MAARKKAGRKSTAATVAKKPASRANKRQANSPSTRTPGVSASVQPVAAIDLPAGFAAVVGDFAQTIDWHAEPTLQGVVTNIEEKTFKRGRKEEQQKVMTVKKSNGIAVSVWESASLRSLFNTASVGDEVFIQYLGEKDVGQKLPMKQFQCAIKPKTHTPEASRKSRRNGKPF